MTAMTFDRADRVQRAIRRLAATGPVSWLAVRLQHHLDRPVFRLTGGRHTLLSLMSGLPVVFLTTTGARTGQRRTSPVLGFPTEEGLVVIASNFGQKHHPAWYHNLHSNAEAELATDGRRWKVRAFEAEGEQRERIWRQGLTIYPGWSQYEKRAPNRRIAVFVLEPL
jgi:deazaflavin-dependent oxidoreductase (nitroreductase family)